MENNELQNKLETENEKLKRELSWVVSNFVLPKIKEIYKKNAENRHCYASILALAGITSETPFKEIIKRVCHARTSLTYFDDDFRELVETAYSVMTYQELLAEIRKD